MIDVPQPNPTTFLDGFRKLLDYLIRDEANGGCGWPPSSIHLFGFGQGGSAALEGAIAWTRGKRGEAKMIEIDKDVKVKNADELGSIVNICGALLSVSKSLCIFSMQFH